MCLKSEVLPPAMGLTTFESEPKGRTLNTCAKEEQSTVTYHNSPCPQGELSLILFLLSKSKIRKRHKVFSLQTESLRGKQAGLEKDSLVLC